MQNMPPRSGPEDLVQLHDQLIARKFFLRLLDEHIRTDFGVITTRSKESMQGFILTAARQHDSMLTQSPLMQKRNPPNTPNSQKQTENDFLIRNMNQQQRTAAIAKSTAEIASIQQYQTALTTYHALASEGKLSSKAGTAAIGNLNNAREALPLMVKRGLDFMAKSYGFDNARQFDTANATQWSQQHPKLFTDSRFSYPTMINTLCNIGERYLAANSVAVYNERKTNTKLQKDYVAHEASQRQLKANYLQPAVQAQNAQTPPRPATPESARAAVQQPTSAPLSTRSASPTPTPELASPRGDDSASRSDSPPPKPAKPPRQNKNQQGQVITAAAANDAQAAPVMTAVARKTVLPIAGFGNAQAGIGSAQASPLASPTSSDSSTSMRTASASPRMGSNASSAMNSAASSPRTADTATTTPRSDVSSPPASPRSVGSSSPATPRRPATPTYDTVPPNTQIPKNSASNDQVAQYAAVPANTQRSQAEMASAAKKAPTTGQYGSVRNIDRHDPAAVDEYKKGVAINQSRSELVRQVAVGNRERFSIPETATNTTASTSATGLSTTRPLPTEPLSSAISRIPIENLKLLGATPSRPLPAGKPPVYPPANASAIATTVAVKPTTVENAGPAEPNKASALTTLSRK